MRLEALLRAHGFMKVERPPELWEADTEDVRLLPLLGEMLAAGLGSGAPLEELTLNASNVVVQADESEESPQIPRPGEYVALTVSGHSDFGPDDTWFPGSAPGQSVLARLREPLETAGAKYAYVRRIPPRGSCTIFLARLAVTAGSRDR